MDGDVKVLIRELVVAVQQVGVGNADSVNGAGLEVGVRSVVGAACNLRRIRSSRSSLSIRKKRGEDLRTRRKYSASIRRVLQEGSAAKATSGCIANRKGAIAAGCVARPSATEPAPSSFVAEPLPRRSCGTKR